MKMVKSLFLGSAAALVAMTGAQAADLPVKAKPVQYVKICSLYGAGFYYIPGTDMCLKVGGWARVYDYWGANGNSTNGSGSNGSSTNGSGSDGGGAHGDRQRLRRSRWTAPRLPVPAARSAPRSRRRRPA